MGTGAGSLDRNTEEAGEGETGWNGSDGRRLGSEVRARGPLKCFRPFESSSRFVTGSQQPLDRRGSPRRCAKVSPTGKARDPRVVIPRGRRPQPSGS